MANTIGQMIRVVMIICSILCQISQVLRLGPLDLTHWVQHRLQPRHSMSLSVVCPEILSWDLGLKSYPNEKSGIEPTTPGLQGE